MVNDKAILVGVDGSDASYKATWWAANYAKHAGLTLQIVCAYSLPSYAAVSFDATYTALGDDKAAHNDAQEILSKAKAIADEQGVEATTLIVTGDPASVFVELSRNYNLIVIGNRGKGGLAERLLGTTSSSLPAYAYCPIIVVPYTDDDGKLMHLNNTITKVAVGSDETRWGIKALEIAASFANSWGAELDVTLAVPSIDGLTGSDSDEEHGIMESYMEDLDVRIKPLQAAYPDLRIFKSIVPGSAVQALTKASHEHDVVVVGSRGRGGFTGLLLGSTSQGLLQHAVSPVYVVPRKYVEASESGKTPNSPADVPIMSLEEISGVQQVDIPSADAQLARDIDAIIDPLRQDDGEKKPE
ncbi:universal stress protein [Bifidobacterium crudilactis]|jgi:nucleotide-binding universal stress UspA family protein|uniref:Universal stress protein n=2 Tax=Bifidobacterium crudilactis TaxID=327277 RepID=A0A971CYX8_9BIFI|nr:universal stress protein [Bifidobacterium crudilactis]MCI1218077.1 universal stress protein [Bifidobacterium crudilactis]MCI1637618.1 universal stress protein [Bifidobacterium crudilactis]MCI1644131.1 universal stress protein [Bifidobacterium crudilactis]MCI1889161.1 universal stress protein [Bifidobacterium crudilactis]MCI2158650.1 universal stress protein [Bifidobacterium crudilactis]